MVDDSDGEDIDDDRDDDDRRLPLDDDDDDDENDESEELLSPPTSPLASPPTCPLRRGVGPIVSDDIRYFSALSSPVDVRDGDDDDDDGDDDDGDDADDDDDDNQNEIDYREENDNEIDERDDDDEDYDRPVLGDARRTQLDDLRSLSGDSLSPVVALNLETLSRLRESGVSPATALALLQEAVRIGKASIISVILETYKDQGLDLNAVDSLGKTPLFWSVMHGIPEVTRLLIDHGADIGQATLPTRSLLHWAAWQGNDDVIRCLLETGADVNAFDVYSKTPLHLCCESLNYHGSLALLDFGAEASLTDSDDCEPLHLLSANGGVRIAQMILERGGVDVNAYSQLGTPLHLACKYNHVSLVRLLVAFGADVNALHPNIGVDGASPLTRRLSPLSSVFADVSSGSSKDEDSMLLIIEFLLRKGAFVHWRGVDASAEAPIVGAVEGGFESCALLLARHGSPADVRVNGGGTSLLLKACRMRMEGFVRALLLNGIDLSDEQWLRAPEHPDSLAEELDILSTLRESHLKEPYSLRTLAASTIRTRLGEQTNASILGRIDALPLPKTLKSTLKLDDVDYRNFVKISELD